MKDSDKLLYKVKRVENLLDISKTTVYKLINKGELELVKVGNSSRITASSVDLYIESKKMIPKGSKINIETHRNI